jgi:hypothetical protein
MRNSSQNRPQRFGVCCCTLALLLLVNVRVALAGDDAAAPAGLRVFYTGHSFHMFVPPLVDEMAKAAGVEGHKLAGRQGIGGSRVIQHWELEDEKNTAKPALAGGQVDVLTMAAHVAIPDEGITKFTELGLAHNPNLRLLVQASWYPFDVPGDRRIRDNTERDHAQIADLQAAVDEWRTRLEAQVDGLNEKHGRKAVFIVPVGDAVVKLRELIVKGEYPGVMAQSELFRDPIGHGGVHIQALAACCNYAAIYRTNPVGLSAPAGGLEPAQRQVLQELAWETVSGYERAGVPGGAEQGGERAR